VAIVQLSERSRVAACEPLHDYRVSRGRG
jgi:hypothetical protein